MDSKLYTIEDIAARPEEYGAATFDEFARNIDAYRIRKDDLFVCMENGVKILRSQIKDQFYVIGHYKTKKIEEAYKICEEMGWDMFKVDMKPELRRTTAGKYTIEVRLYQKEEATDGNSKTEKIASS